MPKELIQQYEDAGIIRRIAAFLIDLGFLIFLPLLIYIYSGNEFLLITCKFSIVITFILYQSFLIWKVNRTVGMMVLRVKVVYLRSDKIPFPRALLRGFLLGIMTAPVNLGTIHYVGVFLILLFPLFFMDPALRKRRNGLDFLVGTCVIKVCRRGSNTYLEK